MWTFAQASALGLALGAALGVVSHLMGFDQVSNGNPLYAAAYAAVESAVEFFGELN